jgi:transposase-like protein
MNDRNYRKYSQEFKLEALELLQRGARALDRSNES